MAREGEGLAVGWRVSGPCRGGGGLAGSPAADFRPAVGFVWGGRTDGQAASAFFDRRGCAIGQASSTCSRTALTLLPIRIMMPM